MKTSQTKYKAIFYARVSTVHDEQSESIDNQILQARNMLDKRPDIQLIEPLETYCEKVSAKSDERPKFQEVLRRLEAGDANLLIVKDMKRFSRSVEVSYRFFNMMEQYGIKIYILSTNKILDAKAFEESENMILLGIEAIIAENQVRTQSGYGKIVQQIRCENKILSYKDAQLFGYYWDYEKGDIAIDEEKAEIVREVYDRYVFRRESIKSIRKYLLSIGYEKSAPTISKWLQEGKYVGDWTINRKSSKLQIGSGKKTVRFNLDKSKWVHIERPDLAIVDQGIFDMAQRIRAENTRETASGAESRARFIGKHLFAGKIYCAECGSIYRHGYADRAKMVAVYRDTFGIKSIDKNIHCVNKKYSRIYEKDMKTMTLAAYNGLVQGGNTYFDMLLQAIEHELMKDVDLTKRKRSIQVNISKIEARMKKIASSFVDATPLMRQALNDELAELKSTADRLNDEILRIENESESIEDRVRQVQEIKERLNEWSVITESDIDRELIKALIKKILIHSDGVVEIQLNVNSSVYSAIPELTDKENPKQGSPIIMRKIDYRQEARRLMDVISAERKSTRVMIFEMVENLSNISQNGTERRFIVAVDLYLVSE